MIRVFTRECSDKDITEQPKDNNKTNVQPEMEPKANMEAVAEFDLWFSSCKHSASCVFFSKL